MSAVPAAALIALAERLADAARPIVLGRFGQALAADAKADLSPVTVADREAEAAMRALIEDRFPDHGIIGEELGSVRVGARYVWVLDPIDGTQSFVVGKPTFGTLIALLDDGRPVIGVIDAPAMGDRWVGVTGRPTLRNGRVVTTRAAVDLAGAWLCATSPEMFRAHELAAFGRLRARCRRAVYGTECIAYGLLAAGTVDLIAEATMQPYDYLPLVPVVTGAGGVITDWHGRLLGLGSDGTVLAAGSAALHARAIEALGFSA